MYVAYDSKDEVFNALDKDIEKNIVMWKSNIFLKQGKIMIFK